MWLWFGSGARQYAWITRSHAFRGLIPHFGYAERYGLRRYRSLAFHPPKGYRWTRQDFVLLFRGTWVVCSYKLIDVKRFPTKEMAEKHFHDSTRASTATHLVND